MVNRIALLVKAPDGKKVRNPLNPTHIITDERFVEVGYHRDIMKYINRGTLIRGERGVDDMAPQFSRQRLEQARPVSADFKEIADPEPVSMQEADIAIDPEPMPQDAVWSEAPRPKGRRRRKRKESSET